MAPHSGADHARTSGVGSMQIGSRLCNADRGRNLARRRIKGSTGCVRASLFVRQTLETPASAPTMQNLEASFATSNG